MACMVKRWLFIPCAVLIVSLFASCAPDKCSSPPPPCAAIPDCSIAPEISAQVFLPPLDTSLQPLLSSVSSPVIASNKFKVFVTNDVHGYVIEDAKKGRIGYALLKGYIDDTKQHGFTTFLLDAGDAFSGSAYAQFDSGRSVASLMGRMGYRVMEPGNHAFDYNLPEKDPLYYSDTLIKTVAANNVNLLDVVCVNLARNGEPLPGMTREPIILHDGTGPGGDGLRLVAVGVITPYAASATNKGGLPGYDFGLVAADGKPSHAGTKRAILDRLADAIRQFDRPEDVVIVLSHVGHDDSDDYARGQITGRDLAAVPNVDFVADAHSHTRAEPEHIGSAVYGSGGRYLEGFNEITIIADGGAIIAGMELRKHADLAGIVPAPEMLAVIETITEKLGMNDKLFEVPDGELLSDDRISLESTGLGRFLCRTMLRITNADLALYNSGGIRSGFSQGWATVGSVYNATPFMNDLQTFAMTGEQILAMFNSLPAVNTNGFPQFYGMTACAWTEGDGPSPKLRVAGILDRDGAPLEMDKTYVVALNSFMAGGGDGFTFEKLDDVHNFGDLTTTIIRMLRNSGDPYLEALRTNNTLIIFANEFLAKKAWEKANKIWYEAIRKAG